MFKILLEIRKGSGGGGIFSLEKGNSGKIGVSCEIPSVVRVWIFSGA